MTIMSHGNTCQGCNPDGPPEQPYTSETLPWPPHTRTLICDGCGQEGHSDPWCTPEQPVGAR